MIFPEYRDDVEPIIKRIFSFLSGNYGNLDISIYRRVFGGGGMQRLDHPLPVALIEQRANPFVVERVHTTSLPAC